VNHFYKYIYYIIISIGVIKQKMKTKDFILFLQSLDENLQNLPIYFFHHLENKYREIDTEQIYKVWDNNSKKFVLSVNEDFSTIMHRLQNDTK